MTEAVTMQPFTETERGEIARLLADARMAQMLLNATFRGILFGRGYDDQRAARAAIAPDASGWLEQPESAPTSEQPDEEPGGTG